MIKKKHKYILIIDEYHKLISDSGYRNKSLVQIDYWKRSYLKFIGLTGTPYGCISKEGLKEENTEIIKYQLKGETQKVKSYNIVLMDGKKIAKERKSNNNTNDKRFNRKAYNLRNFNYFVRDNLVKGINVIYINNKKTLKDVAKVLS